MANQVLFPEEATPQKVTPYSWLMWAWLATLVLNLVNPIIIMLAKPKDLLRDDQVIQWNFATYELLAAGSICAIVQIFLVLLKKLWEEEAERGLKKRKINMKKEMTPLAKISMEVRSPYSFFTRRKLFAVASYVVMFVLTTVLVAQIAGAKISGGSSSASEVWSTTVLVQSFLGWFLLGPLTFIFTTSLVSPLMGLTNATLWLLEKIFRREEASSVDITEK